jgi:hypothetical protein
MDDSLLGLTPQRFLHYVKTQKTIIWQIMELFLYAVDIKVHAGVNFDVDSNLSDHFSPWWRKPLQ